jgi:hypothetical protein
MNLDLTSLAVSLNIYFIEVHQNAFNEKTIMFGGSL